MKRHPTPLDAAAEALGREVLGLSPAKPDVVKIERDGRARFTAAHFHVETMRPAFDGRREANITISPRSDGGYLFTVRPSRGRPFIMQLEDVAELVIWRSVKTEMKERGR